MDYSPKHVILLKIIIRKAKLDYIELTLILISHFVIKKTVSITLILRMGWRWWRWFSKTRSLSDKNCLLLNIQACKVTVKIDVKSPPPPTHTHTISQNLMVTEIQPIGSNQLTLKNRL